MVFPIEKPRTAKKINSQIIGQRLTCYNQVNMVHSSIYRVKTYCWTFSVSSHPHFSYIQHKQ